MLGRRGTRELLFDTTDAHGIGPTARPRWEAVDRLSRSGPEIPGQFRQRPDRPPAASLLGREGHRRGPRVLHGHGGPAGAPRRAGQEHRRTPKLVGANRLAPAQPSRRCEKAMDPPPDPGGRPAEGGDAIAGTPLARALLRRIESLESRLMEGAPGAASPARQGPALRTTTRAQDADQPAIEQAGACWGRIPGPRLRAPGSFGSQRAGGKCGDGHGGNRRSGRKLGPAVVDHLP